MREWGAPHYQTPEPFQSLISFVRHKTKLPIRTAAHARPAPGPTARAHFSPPQTTLRAHTCQIEEASIDRVRLQDAETLHSVLCLDNL